MIIYFLVLVVVYLTALIVSPLLLLPDVALDSGTAATIATFGHYFGMVWSAIPLTLTALFVAVGVIIGVETKIFSYKALRWVYSKIPGIN